MSWPSILRISSHFNPRTRVGCDIPRRDQQRNENISIHAPGWGATVLLCGNADATAISIHAPGWGATTKNGGMRQPVFISIHAPGWGATRTRRVTARPPRNFNPRTRMGCDLVLVSGGAAKPEFQSTHPHGVRHCHAHVWYNKDNISIHAPAWGATSDVPVGFCFPLISIHAPAWGATISNRDQHPWIAAISIHAPAWGATACGCRRLRDRLISIHAPAWGATCPHMFAFGLIPISIHAPGWGATAYGRY